MHGATVQGAEFWTLAQAGLDLGLWRFYRG